MKMTPPATSSKLNGVTSLNGVTAPSANEAFWEGERERGGGRERESEFVWQAGRQAGRKGGKHTRYAVSSTVSQLGPSRPVARKHVCAWICLKVTYI